MGPARLGARAYIAIAGGIGNTPMLGSRSTFHKAGVGGLAGRALRAGQPVPMEAPAPLPVAGRIVDPRRRPPISPNGRWTIEVVLGPNDDWISAEGHERFFATDWKLTGKSDRTGMRLEGPGWLFTPRATNKPPENGKAPSNIIDQGYPLGAINLAGTTPIILPVDGPSMGGFINPYTVITAAFWKLAQALPGNQLRFVAIDVDVAQERARALSALCGPDAIV
jgi:urea carboxylase